MPKNMMLNNCHFRFGLTSTEMGLINSMNDIINIILVLFMGYYGKSAHKAR